MRVSSNPLNLDLRLGSIAWRVSADLPLTIPWRVAVDTRDPNASDTTCPTLPDALLMETPGHFVPLPTESVLIETELKLPYHVAARFVLQTPPGRALQAWLDGEPLHAHEGGYQVPAIHRPGFTGKSGSVYKRGWHRLTIAVAAGEEGNPGRLFVGIGDAATWDWVRGLEWRISGGG